MGKRVRRQWENQGGFVIAAAAVLAVVLGVIGLRQAVPGRSFTDYLYRSLQLFVVYVEQSGIRPGPTPLALDIARFLAPATAAAASVRAVLALFGQRAAAAWVRYFVREHVVVCGLVPYGARLATRFHDAGHRVVALERDGHHPAVQECRADGVIVLIGNAMNPVLLGKAGVAKARYLVVTCGDDGTNAEVAAAAREVVRGRRRKPLPCFLHMVETRLYELLRELAVVGGESEDLRFEFFNPIQSVPPVVLDKHPPATPAAADGSGVRPHVLVVGLGPLGKSLVVHAARQWMALADQLPLRITLVDADANAARRELAEWYPRLERVCEITDHPLAIESPGFARGDFLKEVNGTVTAVYVCIEKDARALNAALTVSRRLRRSAVPVVVLTEQRSGMAALVREARRGAPGLFYYDVVDRACDPEVLLKGTNEMLAQVIHRDYVRHQRALGRVPEDNPALRDWADLPETLKDANRDQAAHIGAKLEVLGYGIEPWTDWDAERVAFSPEEIERMAEMEHERWCQERASEGWRYGLVRDDERKTTPYLAPWENIPDDVKQVDRDAVRGLPDLLARAGFAIVRVGDGERAEAKFG